MEQYEVSGGFCCANIRIAHLRDRNFIFECKKTIDGDMVYVGKLQKKIY